MKAAPDGTGSQTRSSQTRPHVRLQSPLRGFSVVLATAVVLSCERSLASAQQLDSNFWTTDGSVLQTVLAGNTLYIGGDFQLVGPYTGGGTPLDTSSGTVLPGFPSVHGSVYAVTADGQGGWFIGGYFDSVGGFPRRNTAQLRADLSVSPWNPNANGTVHALVVGGSTVYAGGDFTSIGGQARNYIAALDATSGAATDWNPDPNYIINDMAVSGGTVYVGGGFTIIGGQGRNYAAALDATSGAATTWNPDPNDVIYALAVDASTVYVGGRFTSIGGLARNGIAALDATSGIPTEWNPNVGGFSRSVSVLAVGESTVYAGGDFTSIGGQPRSYVAALDATSGAATAWNPNASGNVSALAVSGSTVYAGGDFTSVGGQERFRIAALDATSGAATAWKPNANSWVWALAVSGSTVYAGGDFTSIGGQPRSNIAALDVTSGTATDWNPGPNGGVTALAVGGNTVYVGGVFTSIGGQARNGIAALDAGSGTATSWDPGGSGGVAALVVNGSTVYAGGYFNSIGGEARNFIAALDAQSGAATGWNPGANFFVTALAMSGGTIYVGGWFTSIGGQNRNHLASLDATTGVATDWDPNADGNVRALAVSEGTVYAGGDFTSVGGQPRNYVAALDATGAATAWDPDANGVVKALAVTGSTVYAGGHFTNIGGQARSHIAAVDGATGQAMGWNPSVDDGIVNALAVGGAIYAGGQFRGGLAVFRGFPIIRASGTPLSGVATVGDTANVAFAIRNAGLQTLTISGFEASSQRVWLNPSPPFDVAPGAEAQGSLLFETNVPGPYSGEIRIASNDPYIPSLQAPYSFEALGLTVQSRALTTGDSIPLGQAVTIQVIPDVGRHIERGALYFRSAGETTFSHVSLAPSASTFIGIIPGEAVREGGIEYYIQLENSGVFATDPPGAPDDSLFRIAVAAPTSIAAFARPTDGSGYLPDRAIPVEVTLPTGTIYTSGSLHYRRGGETTYSTGTLATTERPGILSGTIPAAAVGPRGVEYWVEVHTLTSTGPLTFPSDGATVTPATIRVTIKTLQESSAHPGSRYRMVGFPLDFGSDAPSLDALLSNQFGAYVPTQWRVFRYSQGANVELAPGDPTSRFRPIPGRAFWLISRADHRLNSGLAPGLSTPTRSGYPVPVLQGWNQIANPFDFPVAWASVRRPPLVAAPIPFNSSLGTAGDYADSVQVLEPFSGYFVFVSTLSVTPETLWVEPVEARPAASKVASPESDSPRSASWLLRVRAVSENASDGSNAIGIDPSAAEGLDALDGPKPPSAPGDWVRLGFRLTPEGAGPDLYRRDIRPPVGDGHTWEIEVQSSDAGERITLDAVAAQRLPDDIRLRLIDRELGITLDLRRADGTFGSYELLSHGPSRAYHLSLLAGSEDYVTHSHDAEVAVPARVVLDPMAPNPSRSVARIRFGLPRPDAVTLEVFDVLGHRVASLLDRAWRPAGYHALLWDGSGRGGAPAPAGIYFCRLSIVSADEALTRRIVRLH